MHCTYYAGLLAAEADGGAGLKTLVARAGGTLAKAVPKNLKPGNEQVPFLPKKKGEFYLPGRSSIFMHKYENFCLGSIMNIASLL